MGGAGDVRADQGLVQRWRDLGEPRRVLGHQPDEVRASRCQRDDLDQSQRVEVGAVEQVSASLRAPMSTLGAVLAVQAWREDVRGAE